VGDKGTGKSVQASQGYGDVTALFGPFGALFGFGVLCLQYAKRREKTMRERPRRLSLSRSISFGDLFASWDTLLSIYLHFTYTKNSEYSISAAGSIYP
jgi:hypothetical protein